MEARAVEELPEHFGHLLFRDARPVVLDDEAVVVARLGDFHVDVGLDARLLRGVERVVHRLLDGGDQPAGSAVEAQHVLVLLEELGDGDLPLALRQLLCDPRLVTECRLERGHFLMRIYPVPR